MSKDNGTATIDPRSMPWPTTDGAQTETAEASAVAATDEGADAAEATAATDAPETTETSKPAKSGEAAQATTPPPAGPAKTRRDNPLVAGLVRAMRDAAQTAREDSLARFAESAKAQVEGIHSESAEAAAAIRRQSDQDIIGIRDWSKSEMARIREETEGQIGERRRQLEIEVERHAGSVEHRIKLVEAAVARFESEMDSFFKTLLAEEDPAKLAGYAEQVPEPPTFDDDIDFSTWTPDVTLESGDAAAAEEDFLAGLRDAVVEDTTDDDDAITPVASADGTVEATLEDDGSSAEADADMPALDDQDVVDRLAKFTDPASSRDELTTTRLSVVGLISVASIAGFKRAIGRAPGVRSVNVASGPGGDFVFTVQHAPTTDFRTLIPELDGFAASITGDADGVLTVSATEPAGTN